jgi:hypothetical protein
VGEKIRIAGRECDCKAEEQSIREDKILVERG